MSSLWPRQKHVMQTGDESMSRIERIRRQRREQATLKVERLEERCVLSLLGLDLLSGGLPLSSFLAGAGLIGTEATVNGNAVPAWILGEAADGPARTPATQVVSGATVVLAGVIGDNPLLGPSRQANDVDFFTLVIDGQGPQAVRFQLLAPSLGSGLDPSLAIYDAQGELIWNGRDTSWLHLPDGGSPSEVFATLALNPGTYYVAVSATGNEAEQRGGFSWADPLGGTAGGSSGEYALVVSVEDGGAAPSVVAASVAEGDLLDEAPTEIVLTLSEPVAVEPLLAGEIYLVGPDGERITLTPAHYDPEAGTLRFLLNERLANGTYTLVVSREALVDGAGQVAASDFTVTFTVAASQSWGELPGQDVAELDLGHLFEAELTLGVAIGGSLGQGDADAYRFELPTDGLYQLVWNGPAGAQLVLTDHLGQIVASWNPASGEAITLVLGPGVYRVVASEAGASGDYELALSALWLSGGQLDVDAEVPQVTLTISHVPSFGQGAPVVDAGALRALEPTQELVWQALGESASREHSDGDSLSERGGARVLPNMQGSPIYTAPVLVVDPFTGRSAPVPTQQVLQSLEAIAVASHRAGAQDQVPAMSTLSAALYALRHADTSPHDGHQADVDWSELVREAVQQDTAFHDATAIAEQVLERRLAAEGGSAEDLAAVAGAAEESDAAGPETALLVTASAGATLGGTAAKSVTFRRALARLLRRLADRLA